MNIKAQPGSIDTSFHVGTGFNIAYVQGYGLKALAIQPDRKIIVAGTFTSYNGTDFQKLIRLDTNGVIDSSYSIGTGFNGNITAIYMLKDTTLLVAGAFTTFNSTNVKGLIKLNKNGTLNSAFNPLDSNISQVNAIAVDTATGKIYIGGYFTSVGNTTVKHIARLMPNGSLDNSFNVGTGFTHLTYAQAPVYTLKVQPDGNLLVGGDFNFYNGEVASRLCRLLPSGTIDASFYTMFNGNVNSVDLMSDGKIIVGGEFTSAMSNPFNNIVSLNTDGTVNTSFDIGTGISGSVNIVRATPDNKILVGGGFNFFNNVQTMGLVQLNANGSRNSNFVIGTGFTCSSGNSAHIYSILVQPDSNIVVGGFFYNYQDSSSNHIVRLIGKGASQISAPELTTKSATLITNNSARLGGDITDNGNSSIIAQGVCWSTSQNPSLEDNSTSASLGNNNFTVFVNSLNDTTRYYVRAYAINGVDTAYGDQKSFLTRSNENYTCGEVAFTYNGTPVTYGTVKGKYGRCWMDRNLGAEQVAQSIVDTYSYGAYYQWGRKTDGHQIGTSGTTTTLASGTNPTHSDFITVQNAPFDWTLAPDNNLWSGLNAENNPCPSGWRLPTSNEFTTEMTLWSELNYIGAFESALRLPAAGVRGYLSGSKQNEGAWASYWTSEAFTSANANVKMLTAENTQAQIVNTYRAMGASVRCIKDYTVGVEESKLQNSTFSIYPNPANNSITINYSGDLNEKTSISICNYLGQEMLQSNLQSNTTTINVSDFSNGIYFIKIRTNKTQAVQRLVIQK